MLLPITAISSLTVTGCSNEESVSTNLSHTPISVSGEIATRMTETEFELDDKINIGIVTSDGATFVENGSMIYDGEKFFNPEITWYNPVFTGTITAANAEIGSRDFNVELDQSTKEGYARADLVMARKSDVIPSKDGVSLQFKHMMSRLEIVIYNDEGYTYDLVKVKNSATVAVIYWDEMIVSGRTYGEIYNNILCYKVSENNWALYLAPQTRALEIEVPVSGTEYGNVTRTFRLQEKQFLSGYKYKASINLKIDELPITYTPITSLGPIDPWEEGGNVNEEPPTPEPSPVLL